MNPDLPLHLHATRDLLMGSLRAHPTESAPAIPAELLEDLTCSVAVPPVARRASGVGFFESLRSMFASPAFGAAAAAIMVLAVASTVVLRPDAGNGSESFRGAGAYAATDSARVILIGAPVGMLSELEASTDLEDGTFFSASGPNAAAGLEGPRVLVDFASGTITGLNAKGEKVYERSLPESVSGLSLEIASALTRL